MPRLRNAPIASPGRLNPPSRFTFTGVDCFYFYNLPDANSTNGSPIVQANSIDNINLMAPGVNISNICARENGSTGGGT